MKNCIQCGNELNDHAKFCAKCGTKQPEEEQKRFCEQCGAELTPDAKFCPSCAASVGGSAHQVQQSQQSYSTHTGNSYQPQQPYYGAPVQKSLIQIISEKEKLAAVLWIIVASLQIILGIFFCYIFMTGWMDDIYIFNIILIFFVAGMNYLIAYFGFKFASKIQQNPTGIIQRYQKASSFVGTLIYNCVILLFSIAAGLLGIIIGIVAVAASIFYLVGLRSFVLQNAQELQRIEQGL